MLEIKLGKTQLTLSALEVALLLRMSPAGTFVLRAKTQQIAQHLIGHGLIKGEFSHGELTFSIRPKGVRIARAIDKMVW